MMFFLLLGIMGAKDYDILLIVCAAAFDIRSDIVT